MDYSNLDKVVDFRETNFPSNPKSWRNDGTGWPYSTVATTAIIKPDSDGDNVTIYSELSNLGEVVSVQSWDVSSLSSSNQIDAYFGSLTLPDVDSAELLLINPDLIYDRTFRDRFINRLVNRKGTVDGLAEAEILQVHKLLKWCWHNHHGTHTVSKTSASQSCYGKGG
jgi:hypothetical protein